MKAASGGKSYKRQIKRFSLGSALAEFGPALFIFCFIILIPLIDLLSFVWGVGTVLLVANLTARQASPGVTFSLARLRAQQAVDSIRPLINFARIRPLENDGWTMTCLKTKTALDRAPVAYSKPGGITISPQDLLDNIYQYEVTATYDVSPLFNFKGFPLGLGNIPGLGKPARVSFISRSPVEHPEGLNQ